MEAGASLAQVARRIATANVKREAQRQRALAIALAVEGFPHLFVEMVDGVFAAPGAVGVDHQPALLIAA